MVLFRTVKLVCEADKRVLDQELVFQAACALGRWNPGLAVLSRNF
jgi:hypothetical protein